MVDKKFDPFERILAPKKESMMEVASSLKLPQIVWIGKPSSTVNGFKDPRTFRVVLTNDDLLVEVCKQDALGKDSWSYLNMQPGDLNKIYRAAFSGLVQVVDSLSVKPPKICPRHGDRGCPADSDYDCP